MFAQNTNKPPLIANRLKTIRPSPTLAVNRKAAELRASGLDVIDLGVGEPDFPTPLHIIEAAKVAMDKGETKYTIVDGSMALKKAICGKFERENNLKYATDQITVGTGAKQVLFNALFATINPGEEVPDHRADDQVI